MNKKTAGLLIGMAAGLGLAWHYRGLVARGVKRVPIVLRRRAERGGGVDPVPDVELKLFPPEPMLWDITNPSDEDRGGGEAVTVRIDGWRKHGEPSMPAVLAVSFERAVKPGQTKPIPALANIAAGAGEFKYDIYVDGELALDPIVKLVL